MDLSRAFLLVLFWLCCSVHVRKGKMASSMIFWTSCLSVLASWTDNEREAPNPESSEPLAYDGTSVLLA